MRRISAGAKIIPAGNSTGRLFGRGFFGPFRRQEWGEKSQNEAPGKKKEKKEGKQKKEEKEEKGGRSGRRRRRRRRSRRRRGEGGVGEG